MSMSILNRVLTAAIRNTRISPEDIHAISFDGYISGFQDGLKEGYMFKNKYSESDVCSPKVKSEDIAEVINKMQSDQVDLEEFCLQKSEQKSESDHPLYMMRYVQCEVNGVMRQPGSSLDFHLVDGPYDEQCKDYIATISFLDIEKEINVFVDAGYTESMLNELYDSMQDGYYIELPKPVFVKVGYRVSRFNLQSAK